MAGVVASRTSFLLRFSRVRIFFALPLLFVPFVRAQVERQDGAASYDLGLNYFRQGRFNEARPPLEKAVALSPDSADAWKLLGLTLLKLTDYTDAVRPLKHACDLSSGADEACYLQGRALFLLARYDEAVEPLEKALRNASREDKAKVARAVAINFDKLSNAIEAERHFHDAIRSYRPEAETVEDPRLDYGAFLIRQGRAEEALEPLKQALSAHSGSLAANRELGRALLDLDRPAAALPYLEKAVAGDPAAWNIRMLLGKAYIRLGRVDDGTRELQAGREGWAKANHGSSTRQ